MVEGGEIAHLVAERVWQEMYKALAEKHPQAFFHVLRETGALKVILPEVDVLYGIPNPPQWHPEIDTGIHTMMVLEQATKLSALPLVRFAALCHDLGKGVTPEKFWPKHRGHEETGVRIIKAVCRRMRIPKEFEHLACLGSRYHLHAHKAFELRPETIFKLLEAFDFFRRPELFSYYLDICEADYRGRGGFEKFQYPQRHYLQQISENVASVSAKPLIQEGLSGKEIGDALKNLRIKSIAKTQKQLQKKP